MNPISRSLLVVLASIIFLVVENTDAQLAKQGGYSAHYGWQQAFKVMEMEKDHRVIHYEAVGAATNDAGQGFLHGVAFVCHGVNDIVKGLANNQGYCTGTDRDGDKLFVSYECKSAQPGGRCEGPLRWTEGTGKYAGIKGNSTWYPVAIPNTAAGYAVWKGEWQLP